MIMAVFFRCAKRVVRKCVGCHADDALSLKREKRNKSGALQKHTEQKRHRGFLSLGSQPRLTSLRNNMTELVATFCSATGCCDNAEASQFLEMSGQNVDDAVSLYLQIHGDSSRRAASDEVYACVFGSSRPLSHAWEAEIRVLEGRYLLQEGNGPCGALAALNALMIANEEPLWTTVTRSLERCGDNTDRREGSIAEIVMSAARAKGPRTILEETRNESLAGDLFCGTNLIDLLLTGRALGNFLEGQTKREAGDVVGFLSFDTHQIVCRELRTPLRPVWILHGGDHFTVFWLGQRDVWYHWNGLEPHRKLSRLKLTHEDGRLLDWREEEKEQQTTYQAPRVGHLESIVQSTKEKNWRERRYELSLRTEGESPDEDSLDMGPAPPTDESGWRCLRCYHSRYETGRFGLNEAKKENCQHCGTHISEAGWTIWRNYCDLPHKTQRRIDRDYAPPILATLRTRWRNVQVSVYVAGEEEPIPLGDPRLSLRDLPSI